MVFFEKNSNIHPSWHSILMEALAKVDPEYLKFLSTETNWLPGSTQVLNAFSQPRGEVRYILLGESPYPRAQSANGYAFWDATVDALWSETGFSKAVNRATSLRNMLKMLLLIRGDLQAEDLSQPAIARLDKNAYIKTGKALFENFLQQGFLLLNASLVFQSAKRVKQDAMAWKEFLEHILSALAAPHITLLLFGKIAGMLNTKIIAPFTVLACEHPYNLSFIRNAEVQDFFRKLDLLRSSPEIIIPSPPRAEGILK